MAVVSAQIVVLSMLGEVIGFSEFGILQVHHAIWFSVSGEDFLVAHLRLGINMVSYLPVPHMFVPRTCFLSLPISQIYSFHFCLRH
jgi:hypothetical protein